MRVVPGDGGGDDDDDENDDKCASWLSLNRYSINGSAMRCPPSAAPCAACACKTPPAPHCSIQDDSDDGDDDDGGDVERENARKDKKKKILHDTLSLCDAPTRGLVIIVCYPMSLMCGRYSVSQQQAAS